MLNITTCPDSIGKSRPAGKQFNFRKYCLIFVSLILVFFEAQAQSGAWTRKADLPTPRVGASASVVNNKIYVIGGMNASYNDFAVNEVFDPLTNTWDTTKAPMPTARSYLLTAVVNDTIYAIGGGYPNTTKKVEVYGPVTNTWDTTKEDMPYPWRGVYGDAVNEKIYSVGGNYKRRNCFEYNTATDEWIEKTSIPEGGCVGPLSATVYNGLIYTFGGTYAYVGSYPNPALSSVCVYNPETDTWDTTKAPMPTPRFTLRTFLVNGKIYAIGGSQGSGSTLSTVEVYDPETDTWESKPNMPFKVSWFTGAVYNNKIYVFGGTPDWVTGGNEVWEYDPAFHTDIAAGNVSGTWTIANSPYHVLGEITIPDGQTLTIEPGVEVVFMGHHKLNVQGRLLAIGTQQDPIMFTAEDKEAGWHGVRFNNTPNTNDTSKFAYCSLKYGKANTGNGFDLCGGAVMISRFDKVLVSDCLFDSNLQIGEGFNDPPPAGPALYIYYASPTITNSTFSNNTGSKGSAISSVHSANGIISNNILFNNKGKYGAIASCFNSSQTISGNIIFNNVATVAAGGILVDNSSTSRIENNIIVHNEGPCGGIVCLINSNPILINNTIAYNTASICGGGIACDANSDPVFINNVIYGNTAPNGSQVYINDAQSDPVFVYCDIQGGKDGFGGSGAGVNYTGLYENNIDSDPLFLPIPVDKYNLSNYSPCIGAGIDSFDINGTWYYVPPFCIGGNPRPTPSGTNPDIGACENTLGTPTGVEQEPTNPTEFVLYQNYPNPFNPTTKIGYGIKEKSNVKITILNAIGEEVAVVMNEEKEAGYHQVEFDAERLPSGVYFYRLKAGSYVISKKMILLK